MLGSCARAASAHEARFRIDAPIAGPRSVGVVALDSRAAVIVSQLQQEPWSRARFYRPVGMSWAGERVGPGETGPAPGKEPALSAGVGRQVWAETGATDQVVLNGGHPNGHPDGPKDDEAAAIRAIGHAAEPASPGVARDLWAADGLPAAVADIVRESDVVVMVATDASAAGPAGLVGDIAAGSGVMTVGVVLAEPAETQAVVTAMRPHTRMLMVSKDDGDVPEVLRALRA